MIQQLPPLALYVHLPWCVRKCPYCDFNSHVAPESLPEDRYVEALLQDLDADLSAVQGRELVSIFFGGGTPSLFSPAAIGRFLEGVHARVRCVPDIEITLETNPGTVEHGRFSDYRTAGVNRVSLGAQTFHDEQLRLLGRIHGGAEIHRAVDELHAAGLSNFNLDLMYGLPQQTLEQALADISTALSLAPTHLSHYQLTLEPGTVFYHRPPPLPDADQLWDMQEACQAVLAERGYAQYEISAYAQAGRRCRHNLNYWQFGDYLGLGAGAHGKLTDLASGEVYRTARHRQPREYLNRTAADRIVERRTLRIDELPFEFMLNVLRLPSGFTVPEFEARTGLSIRDVDHTLASARHKNLLESIDGDVWRPTDLGLRFLNDLQILFLGESPTRAAGVARQDTSHAS